MPNTINLRLLENKNIIAELNGIPLAQENSYKIIAGEENATIFKLASKPTQYKDARYTVEMVNSQGYGIAETDIVQDTFALPIGMAIAGYGWVQIRAYQGEEIVPFMTLKVKVWNTLPSWKDNIPESETPSIIIDNQLSTTSTNPVQNKVIANKIEQVESSIENKVSKVEGKGLSTNDYTTVDKEKVETIIINGSGDKFLSNDGTYKSVQTGSGTSVTVDSELDGESTNPVQNKVVKEAFDGKVDKLKKADTGGYNRVYSVDYNGNATNIIHTTSATPDTIVTRLWDGRVLFSEPNPDITSTNFNEQGVTVGFADDRYLQIANQPHLYRHDILIKGTITNTSGNTSTLKLRISRISEKGTQYNLDELLTEFYESSSNEFDEFVNFTGYVNGGALTYQPILDIDIYDNVGVKELTVLIASTGTKYTLASTGMEGYTDTVTQIL